MIFDNETIFRARCTALKVAQQYQATHSPYEVAESEVIRTAGHFLPFLLAQPARIEVTVSPVTFDQATGKPAGPTQYVDLGGYMAVAMQDNQYVTLTVAATDAAGHPTADSGITWAADQSALVQLVPSADGTQVNVALAAGAALPTSPINITATDSAGNVSPADPITITGGPPTTLGITAGTPQAIPSTGVPTPSG